MTTNHIDRLSSALIRPGRVDMRLYFGPATRQQARDLFVSFYRDMPHVVLDRMTSLNNGVRAEGKGGLQDTGGKERGLGGDMQEGGSGRVIDATWKMQQAQQQQQQHSVLSEEELQRLADAFAAALPAAAGAGVRSIKTPAVQEQEQRQQLQQEVQQQQQIQQVEEPMQQGSLPQAAVAEGSSGQNSQRAAGLMTDWSNIQGRRLTGYEPGQECNMSMAALQGHLMTWKRDPWGAVEQVGSIVSHGRGGSRSNSSSTSSSTSNDSGDGS